MKLIGKIAKGIVRTKAKLLTGNVPGAVKSAVGVVKDTVELVGNSRSSRTDNAPRTNTQRSLDAYGIQQRGRQIAAPPGSAPHVALMEFQLRGQLERLDPQARAALLDVVPTVDLPPLPPSAEPGGRCGFGQVFGTPVPVDGAPTPLPTAPTGTGPHALPGQSPVGVVPTSSGAVDAAADESAMNPTDGASLLRMMESQPERFREAWEGLSESDRQLAMMNLQRQLQAISQLSTMITNMLQTQHGAAMAVARNLAV